MSGTKAGARRSRDVLLAQDPDFYKRVGALGGAAGRGPNYDGGFAAGEVGRLRARMYGAIGGAISTKSKRKPTPEERAKIRRKVERDKTFRHLLAIHQAAQRDL